jgi:hypothetical protein
MATQALSSTPIFLIGSRYNLLGSLDFAYFIIDNGERFAGSNINAGILEKGFKS